MPDASMHSPDGSRPGPKKKRGCCWLFVACSTFNDDDGARGIDKAFKKCLRAGNIYRGRAAAAEGFVLLWRSSPV